MIILEDFPGRASFKVDGTDCTDGTHPNIHQVVVFLSRVAFEISRAWNPATLGNDKQV